jgi:hypothetical protein
MLNVHKDIVMSQVSFTERFAEHQRSVQEELRKQRDAIAAGINNWESTWPPLEQR